MSWALFVEGLWDEFFIRCLLQRLGVEDVTVGHIGGGVSALHMVAQQIRRRRADGMRVALILDADTSAKRTGEDLARELRRLELQVERSFLLPDDRTEGKLETLLERMAHPSHRVVYRCFDAYVECLHNADRTYSTPDSKARLYAYCHALGAELQASKDYDDPAHWDHDQEKYIGHWVWNKRGSLRDPLTGRRRYYEKPEDEWRVVDDEGLRIVPQDPWDQVRSRRAAVRAV